MGHIRQQILFRSNILSVQHGGCVQLLQVKTDNRQEKNPPIIITIRQQQCFTLELSPMESALSTQVCCTCGHWWPSFINMATFAQWRKVAHHAGIRVCLIYGALIGSDSAAQGAGLHKLQFFAKAPKNHSLSLSASVRPSGVTSHPQLLHFCHTCTLALHAPLGGISAPEGYVYNSICVLIWKRKLLSKRMCRLHYNSEREKLDLADVVWLIIKTPVQKNLSQNLKLDK